MDLTHHQNVGLLAFIQNDGKEERVDLSPERAQEFFKNDIIRIRLTGNIPNLPNLHLANFIESTLHDIGAEGVNFSECDFKDTLVKNATFRGCSFHNATFATSFFSDCMFNECAFYNAAVHSSEFYRVQFLGCNLTNLLIKSSRFVDCEFVECVTSNKILEMSTLDRTTFTSTDIQLQTITSNFGATQEDLFKAHVRSGRIREEYRYLDVHDIEAELQSERWSPIEKLRIEYFLRPDLTQGSIFLDQALDLGRWTQIYKNPGSFIELLESFSEFLVSLYASGRLTMHSILLFHSITSHLTEMLPQKEELHRLAMSIGGTHMVLSRIVEEYLATLDQLISEAGKTAVFLVEGPFDETYYINELAPWFDPDQMQIDFLIEHNSPLELGITAEQVTFLIPLVAVFLATRTKLEIMRVREASAGKIPQRGRMRRSSLSTQRVQKREHLLSIKAGFTTDDPKRYELQVRSLLPGSFLIDFRLQVGTQVVGKIRKIVIDLLS